MCILRLFSEMQTSTALPHCFQKPPQQPEGEMFLAVGTNGACARQLLAGQCGHGLEHEITVPPQQVACGWGMCRDSGQENKEQVSCLA